MKLANDQVYQENTQLTAEALYETLGQAVEFHRTGKWIEAERLYRKILALDPKQPNANHNLGILALDSDQLNESLDYFKTALANDPDEPQFWVSYVDVLIRADLNELATKVLLEGLERGLHGDEVNALVDRLTQAKDQAKQPAVSTNAEKAKTPNRQHQSASGASKRHQVEESCAEFRSNYQVQQALDWMKMGHLKEAKGRLTKMLRYYPKDAFIMAALGVIHLQEGDLGNAADLMRKSLAINPDQAATLGSLAKVYLGLKQFDDAIEISHQAIALDENNAEHYVIRACAYNEMGRHIAAVADFERAKKLRSKNPIVYSNLGIAQHQLKQYELAAENLRKAIELNPDDLLSIQVCSGTCLELKLYEEALQLLDRAIALSPNDTENFNRRGVAKMHLGQLQSAIEDYQQSIRLDPSFPRPYCNLGLTYRKLNQYEAAMEAVNTAIRLDGNEAMYYMNRGLLMVDEQRFLEAEADYEKAIALDAEKLVLHADLHWNKAILYLLQGKYPEGWALFEHRWESSTKGAKRTFVKPLWLGEQSIQGKRLLVHAEQGYGDNIQFCRYVHQLVTMGANVILELPKALMSVMTTLAQGITLVEKGNPLPEFDFHCPMMSLPLACRTTLETIPANVPYLYSEAGKASAWRDKFGTSNRPRVGLVWSGSVGHGNDHNRSLSLSMLAPILSADVEFHVLQKEIREKDIELLKQYPAMQTHCDALNDFSDTAALIDNLDLVISVDTSVAHLAGAMGKKCWVLLPYAPDYRWLLNREDNPWYPTIRLFRQQKERDWTPVIQSVEAAIKQEIAK